MPTTSPASLALFALAGPLALAGDDPSPGWSRFRGPDGSGVALDGTPLPARLDPESNLLWRAPLGPGHSSPVVAGDRLFLTEAGEDSVATVCLERATGRVLWRRELEVAPVGRIHEINSPAAPTPTTDGERVFAYFGGFGLATYDLDGEELWVRPMAPPRNTFGVAASPVAAMGRLFFCSDSNEGSYLEALEPATGDVVWRVDRSSFVSSWSTPVVRSADGVEELLVYGAFVLKAYDARDGAERWSVPGLADEPITTPLVGDGLVYVTSYNMKTNPEVIGLPEFADLLARHDHDASGTLNREEADENRSVLSRFDADGEGDHPLRIFFRFLDVDQDGELTAEEWKKLIAWLDGFDHANAILAIRPGDGAGRPPEIAWQHGRGVPECPSPVLYGGRLYAVKNGGIATCLDAASGAVVWEGRLERGRGPYYASLVAGDGKVYACSAKGVVTVLAAGDELRVLHAADLGERIMATPALFGGVVHVRTETGLLAFGAQ